MLLTVEEIRPSWSTDVIRVIAASVLAAEIQLIDRKQRYVAQPEAAVTAAVSGHQAIAAAAAAAADAMDQYLDDHMVIDLVRYGASTDQYCSVVDMCVESRKAPL